MAITTSSNFATFGGNGVTTVFDFTFVGASSSYISVTYTDADGNATVLMPSQYTLVLNAAPVGQIWGYGGSVTYPLSGSPIANGTTLTVERTVPLTQIYQISNQGNFYPEVVEAALDTLCMEIQQTSNAIGRAITIPPQDPADTVTELPPAAQRANQSLIFDADGNAGVGSPASANVSVAMQPVVAAASIGAAQVLLGITASSGTVTSIATGAGLTGGPITTTGTISLAAISGLRVMANITGGSAVPSANTITAILDATLGSAQGSIIYRDTAAWMLLAPGTTGKFLKTQGAAANPVWDTVSGNGVLNRQTFSGSGTWSKPAGGGSNAMAYIQCWGAGGGGGGDTGGGGGGGGSYADYWVPLASLGATETVTVGAGGTGGSSANGVNGGFTTFSTLVKAYGGSGGGIAPGGNGGAGGGFAATAAAGTTSNDTGGQGYAGVAGYYTGGGGMSSSGNGGASVYGGGGGGAGAGGTGGTSQFGGAGGAHDAAGTAPGGGGGGTQTTNPAGAGAAGRCVVTVWA